MAEASKMAVGRPRSLSGNQEAMALALEGKVGASPDAEQEAGGEEAAEAGGERGGEGGEAPEEDAAAADATDAEAIDPDADGQLEEGVGPVVGAREIAEGDEGDAELGVEGGLGDGEVDSGRRS